jgi:hypothetical protein
MMRLAGYAVILVVLVGGVARANGDLEPAFDNPTTPNLGASVVTRTLTSSSYEVVNGCLSSGAQRVLPMDWGAINRGDQAVSFGPLPSAPCTCGQLTCPGPIVSGNYQWDNDACRWRVRNIMDVFLTTLNGAVVKSFSRTLPMSFASGGALNPNVHVVDQGLSGTSRCAIVPMNNVADGAYRVVFNLNPARLYTDQQARFNAVSRPFSLSGNTVTNASAVWLPRVDLPSAPMSSSSPSVASWGPMRLDSFWTAGGTLRHAWKPNQSWFGPESLGNPGVNVIGTPAAVSWGNGRIDIFVKGSDGRLWQLSYENGWSGWFNPAGATGLASDPAVVSTSTGRLDIVWTSTAGNVEQVSFGPPFGWSSVINLGRPPSTNLVSRPGISFANPSALYIVAAGVNGTLWKRQTIDGAWVQIPNVTGVKGHPAVAVTAFGVVTIVWPSVTTVGAGKLGIIGFSPLSGWTAVAALSQSNVDINNPPALSMRDPAQVDLFVRGSNGSLLSRSSNVGVTFGSSWQQLATDTVNEPAAVSWAQGQNTVVFGATSSRHSERTFF